MKTIKNLIIIFFLFLFATSCDEKKNTFRKANDLYHVGAYKQTEKEYRRVLTIDSTYSKAYFNLANTCYRQGDTNAMEMAANNWLRAFDLFEDKDSLARSNVFYNQGNVKFKRAVDTLQHKHSYNYDLLKEASEDYKKVLRQFPDDSDARYNLSLINYLLSQRPKNNKKNENQQQNQQNQQQQQSKSQQQSATSAQYQRNKDNKDISRMLEALRNNEKNTLKKLKNNKQRPAKHQSHKDW